MSSFASAAASLCAWLAVGTSLAIVVGCSSSESGEGAPPATPTDAAADGGGGVDASDADAAMPTDGGPGDGGVDAAIPTDGSPGDGGVDASDVDAAIPTDGGSDLLPAITLEYVDTSGIRQATQVVDGVTTIAGVAPFSVQIDASGTRAPTAYAAQATFSDEAAHAFLMVGYRINYGEDLGGTWRWPAFADPAQRYSRDEDTGPPLFGRTFTTVGTHNVRLKIRDEAGREVTIGFNVVVSAPPAPVHIPVSQGSWPAWVSGGHYTLQAGGDYSSFGSINHGGFHGILIAKTGVGADPIAASVWPDERSKWSATTNFEPRGRNLRYVGLDMVSLTEGQRGFDYVTVVGGLIRAFGGGGQAFLWNEGNEANRTNARYSRGLFLRGTELRSAASTNGFVMFQTQRGFHAVDTRFDHRANGPTTYLMLRVYGSYWNLRNCLWYSTANGGAANGTTLSLLSMGGPAEMFWRDDDMAGPLTGGAHYGLIGDRMFAYHNQFYDEGSFLTNAVSSTGGNPSPGAPVRPYLVGWEDNVWYPSGDVALAGTLQTGSIGGNWSFWRGNRRNMGAGGAVLANPSAPNGSIGDTVTYNGPALNEGGTNSRPVPTAF